MDTTIDRALIARLNDEITYVTHSIERAAQAQALFADTATPRERATRLVYITGQRDTLNRLYAELSNAWDVSYAAAGDRP